MREITIWRHEFTRAGYTSRMIDIIWSRSIIGASAAYAAEHGYDSAEIAAHYAGRAARTGRPAVRSGTWGPDNRMMHVRIS